MLPLQPVALYFVVLQLDLSVVAQQQLILVPSVFLQLCLQQ